MKRAAGRRAAAYALVFLLGAAGCTSGQSDQPRPEATVPITAHAVLDRANGSIALPLHAYGMSNREAQLSAAAASIVFARCVTGQQAVSSAVVQTARDFLATEPQAGPEWLFGVWDAEYIAAHGRLSSSRRYPSFLKTEPATGKRCVKEKDFVAVELISTTDATDEKYGMLIQYSASAYEKTLRDPRFVQLRSDFGRCLSKKSYALDDEQDIASVKIESAWSDEQELKAVLAAATCNDELRLTQRAGDINASYQQEIIEEHEAELTTIKRTADEHVAQAQKILREVGLI